MRKRICISKIFEMMSYYLLIYILLNLCKGFTGEETSYPNTDSYREGVVTPSGIQITSISYVQGETQMLLLIYDSDRLLHLTMSW